ncbi:MAG: hypothetical protein NVS9B1_10300 [Candidatus Dormibacteraceae bacterium]
MNHGQALGQLDRLGVEGVLADPVRVRTTEGIKESLETGAQFRHRCRRIAPGTEKAPAHARVHRDLDQPDAWHHGAGGTREGHLVAAGGEADRKVDQEGLRSARLDGQQRGDERGDDG